MMPNLHLEHWPKISKSLKLPETSLYENLKVSADRYPDQSAIYYYGNTISYKELDKEVNALAGFLQQKLGVAKGERVLLFMQNSPQFVIGFYAISRADAVVVPINPMLTAEELSFYIKDCEINTALVGQELYGKVEPLIETTPLKNVVVAAYSDYIGNRFNGTVPPEAEAKRKIYEQPGHFLWKETIAAKHEPRKHTTSAGDLVVFALYFWNNGTAKRSHAYEPNCPGEYNRRLPLVEFYHQCGSFNDAAIVPCDRNGPQHAYADLFRQRQWCS